MTLYNAISIIIIGITSVSAFYFKRITTYLLALTFFIVIVAIFLLNEKFEFQKTFDSNKFGIIVSIFGTIINCLTLYFIYLQSKELIASREETIIARISQRRPELFPQNLILNTDDEDVHLGFLRGNNLTVPFFTPNSNITIGNAGLGPAINLTIDWIFDRNEVINFIQQTYDASNQVIEEPVNILFISQENSIQNRIPYLFLMLYGKKLNRTMLDVAMNVEERIKPSLQLRLTYFGTFGEQYTKSFNVNFNAIEGDVTITFTQV